MGGQTELASRVQEQAKTSRSPQQRPDRNPARKGIAVELEQWAGQAKDQERLEARVNQEPTEANQSMSLERKTPQRSYMDHICICIYICIYEYVYI